MSTLVAVLGLLVATAAGSAPWDKYNLSPRNRTVAPVAVHTHLGVAFSDSRSLFPLTLQGQAAFVVLDFGKEIGGFTSIRIGRIANGSVGLAYSESTNYATSSDGQDKAGDHSNGGSGPDGTLSTGALSPNSSYTPPVAQMRGGFRYLNLFLEAAGGIVTIDDVTVHFTASPTMSSPADYKNHFYSSDELLNQIWYGCAYTVQMCSIDPNQGRQWPAPAAGWNNGVLIGSGKSLLVDGAKRDRTVWPGDMGVSSAVAFATLGDIESSWNSLDTLFHLQSPDGQLPYVGPEVFCQKPWGQKCETNSYNSDTYHLWALIGTANVHSFSQAGDAWLKGFWTKYKMAVEASLAKVGSTGLMKVDKTADWQRGGQGGYNIAANALLAHVLQESVRMAGCLNDTAWAVKCGAASQKSKTAINLLLWNETVGAFNDNPDNHGLQPQDGNSLVLWFNLTTDNRSDRIAGYLKSHFTALGAVSPEWIYQGKAAIGTFPGSMEVLGLAASGKAELAVDLIRRQWGYMLRCNNSTQSTFWEGFQANGQYAFRGIYMSHAHGWATGPAAALTFHILGLRPDALAPGSYIVSPQFAGLLWCNGSLEIGGGKVHAEWRLSDNRGSYVLTVDARSHSNGHARIGLPIMSSRLQSVVVKIDEAGYKAAQLVDDRPERHWYEMQGGKTRFEVTTPVTTVV